MIWSTAIFLAFQVAIVFSTQFRTLPGWVQSVHGAAIAFTIGALSLRLAGRFRASWLAGGAIVLDVFVAGWRVFGRTGAALAMVSLLVCGHLFVVAILWPTRRS